MKKSVLKRAVSILLAGIMAVSVFTVTVAAAPGDSFSEAITVTGDFSATVKHSFFKRTYAYYKFVPAETGWYEIYSDCNYDPAIALFDGEEEWLAYSDDTHSGDVTNYNFDLIHYFTAGETYYFQLHTYESKTVTFDVKIDFLGAVETEVISYPDKNEYIMDYECGIYDEDKYYISLDFNGFEVKLTFESGKVFSLKDWDVYYLFEVCYDKPVIGINEICFKIGNDTIFIWGIEIVENPVESIEVVKLPDKIEYTYGLDGYSYGNGILYIYPDTTGMEIKINYIDGTSEIVKFDDIQGDWDIIHNEHQIYVEISTGLCTIGKNTVYVDYLARIATFEITVVKPTMAQTFFIGLINIAEFFSSISIIRLGVWDSIASWFRDIAIKVG